MDKIRKWEQFSTCVKNHITGIESSPFKTTTNDNLECSNKDNISEIKEVLNCLDNNKDIRNIFALMRIASLLEVEFHQTIDKRLSHG